MNRDWVLIPCGTWMKCELIRIEKVSPGGIATEVEVMDRHNTMGYGRYDRSISLNQIPGDVRDRMPKEATAP